MITVDNRSKRSKANHKEHRRLAMLFFLPRDERMGWYILMKERKTKREVSICYGSRTGIC